MPNPGDAGSSLGAALCGTLRQAKWLGPYLGTDIDREVDPYQAVSALRSQGALGIGSGRAEFGPRAFGNRSLIADPRSRSAKARVNQIKQREQFRPFAAVVLEEHMHNQFVVPQGIDCSYMQYTWRVKFPREVPAICHVNSTSRIQTLRKDQNPHFHAILSEWYQQTGCPMLLNTSLNIKGEPLANTWEDVVRFRDHYEVLVL